MNKLIKALISGILLVASVNAFALFDNVGNMIWRANRGDFKISYAMLSSQTIYARVLGVHDVDYSSNMKGLCGDANGASQGKRLFDVLPGATYEECVKYVDGKDLVTFTPIGSRLRTNNYRGLILPRGIVKRNAIVKVKMGNVETRDPPQLLGIVKANESDWDDSCNANGEYNGVTCEGWSYLSIMPLWDTAYPDDHYSF